MPPSRKAAAASRNAPLGGAVQQVLRRHADALAAFAGAERRGRPTPEQVHESRITIRRLIALLWFFMDAWDEPAASRLAKSLHRLVRSLGPARDATVGRRRLESKKVGRAMRKVPGWPAFAAEQAAKERSAYDALDGLWERPAWKKAPKAIATLAGRKPRAMDPDDFAASLKKRIRRLERYDRSELLEDPAGLHATRRKMRRARYLAEDFASLLPRKLVRAAEDLHRLENRLGKIRDLDQALARLGRDPRPAAGRLAGLLARQRKKLAKKI